MNIIFYDANTDEVIGSVIGDNDNPEVLGDALNFVTSWRGKHDGSLDGFAEYYKSWASAGAISRDDEALAAEQPDETVAFTVSDDGEVLELIKSNADGVFVRDNGDWTPVNPDEDQPTIDDQEWIDVNPDEAVAFWDKQQSSESAVTRDDILKYALNSE